MLSFRPERHRMMMRKGGGGALPALQGEGAAASATPQSIFAPRPRPQSAGTIRGQEWAGVKGCRQPRPERPLRPPPLPRAAARTSLRANPLHPSPRPLRHLRPGLDRDGEGRHHLLPAPAKGSGPHQQQQQQQQQQPFLCSLELPSSHQHTPFAIAVPMTAPTSLVLVPDASLCGRSVAVDGCLGSGGRLR
jgi:hypothetical protein